MEAIANDKDDLDIEEGLSEEKPKKRYLKHKLDKKVTVKHFLNKKIIVNKNDKDFERNMLRFDDMPIHGPIYPVYVQITFNRKTTTIKSSTHKNFSEESFENYINKNTRNLFEREQNFIEFYFQNRYKSYLDILAEQFKSSREQNTLNLFHSLEDDCSIFIDNVEENFDINRFMKEYSYNAHELHKYIDSVLYEEIIEFRNKIWFDDNRKNRNKFRSEFQYSEIELENINELPLDIAYWGGIKVSALELLSFLEMRDSRYNELRKRYPSEIWHFTIYYRFLKNNDNNPYLKLPATILDYMNGNFKAFFLSAFKHDREKAQMILDDIDYLVKKKDYHKINI